MAPCYSMKSILISILFAYLRVNPSAAVTLNGNTAEYKGHKYSFFITTRTYDSARRYCLSGDHGRLVEIDTEDEYNFIKQAAEAFGHSMEYFIGVDDTAWYSGSSLPTDFSPWCSGYTHASGPVVLDPTDNNFCWKAPANVEVGAICEKRIRALTLADFYPVEYESSCYLFSYERAFPHSEQYGEHNLADRWCGDVGAEVAVIASAKENEDVVGMATCYLAAETKEDMSTRQLIARPDAGFTDSVWSVGSASDACTFLSGRDGSWSGRDDGGCHGHNEFSADHFKGHVVCKRQGPCPGKWQLVFRHDMASSNGQVFSTTSSARSSNRNDPTANLFSRIDVINTFMTQDSKFHFMLIYPELQSKYNEWVQSSNPIQTKGQEPEGFIPINIMLEAPTTRKYMLDPAEFTVTASSVKGRPNYAEDQIIDGYKQVQGDGNLKFWAPNHAEGTFSWIQIDMQTSRLVASAKMFTRNDDTLRFNDIKNIEMRVGDTPAPGGATAQLSANTICGSLATYNMDQNTEYEFDCQDTPGQSISGRYLTLQKINNNDEVDWDWDVSEVEVYEQATFKGLGYDNNGNSGIPPTLLDWNPSGGLWDFAVGARFDYQDGIPASAGKQVQHVELLAHTYRTDLCYEQGIKYDGGDIGSTEDADSVSCHRTCMANVNCVRWVLNPGAVAPCLLKDSTFTPTAIEAEGMVTGPKYCGSPIYQKRPSCGFPPAAPSGTHLSPPAGLFCPFQTVTYTCDIGGINEIKDQPGISTIDGVCSPEGVLELPEEFGDSDSDPVVPPSVECVASYTCELLDLLIPDTPGKFVCDDLSMPIGSQCHLVCDDGYLPESSIHNTCTYHNATDTYQWLDQDYASFKCVAAIGVVVGGISPSLDYLSSTEIFAPANPDCHNAEMTPYPFRVMGASTGIVETRGLVCGGAVEEYVECHKEDIGGFKCERNAQKVLTLGGSQWITGPATKWCYEYDLDKKEWVKALELKEARVYATSAATPDGKLLIIGGVGDGGAILDTVEVISLEDVLVDAEKDLWQKQWRTDTLTGRMGTAVFGHCAVLSPQGDSIIVAGGFDGEDYSDKVQIYETGVGAWTLSSGQLNQPRFDHSCKATKIRDEMVVLAMGGWNSEGFAYSTEVMDVKLRHWTEMEGADGFAGTVNDVHDEDKPHLRRAGVAFSSGGKVMVVGGTACGTEDSESKRQRCERMNSAVAFTPHSLEPKLDRWDPVQDKNMIIKRSSHAILPLPYTRVCY